MDLRAGWLAALASGALNAAACTADSLALSLVLLGVLVVLTPGLSSRPDVGRKKRSRARNVGGERNRFVRHGGSRMRQAAGPPEAAILQSSARKHARLECLRCSSSRNPASPQRFSASPTVKRAPGRECVCQGYHPPILGGIISTSPANISGVSIQPTPLPEDLHILTEPIRSSPNAPAARHAPLHLPSCLHPARHAPHRAHAHRLPQPIAVPAAAETRLAAAARRSPNLPIIRIRDTHPLTRALGIRISLFLLIVQSQRQRQRQVARSCVPFAYLVLGREGGRWGEGSRWRWIVISIVGLLVLDGRTCVGHVQSRVC